MHEASSRTLKEHSRNFQQMVARAERHGMLEQPDGYGKRVSHCGDSVEMFLAVEGEELQLVTCKVTGCFTTVACGNTVSYLMEGRTLTDAWQLTPDNVIEFLESLSSAHRHCAELAVGAFYDALVDYHRSEREPWKKPYLRR